MTCHFAKTNFIGEFFRKAAKDQIIELVMSNFSMWDFISYFNTQLFDCNIHIIRIELHIYTTVFDNILV